MLTCCFFNRIIDNIQVWYNRCIRLDVYFDDAGWRAGASDLTKKDLIIIKSFHFTTNYRQNLYSIYTDRHECFVIRTLTFGLMGFHLSPLYYLTLYDICT